ncbi:ATP F0F1 synthase subunit B [Sulfitobacter sp. SK012]|uniref:F0F1 ATP synthase subunit B n=1 Tax=Sulfitobacter sp. SK012 TaxID=1389005 RepID=UPI000E0B2417|nr:F0F1 ATP synthase subunit B [Sulfitobacter sp. SK012]AXI45036.1 ATP F0F1 synthase subunit B [Sulfitobacter sp. SK012]
MRLTLTATMAAFVTSPALAAGDRFFSLANTDFVVLLAFLLFIAVLFYFKVPGMVAGMLDKRAEGITTELEEARALREEAQSIFVSYKQKLKEVDEKAARIVASAKEEALAAAELAREAEAKSRVRRMAAAEEQIASAQAAAVKEVRDQAATIAVAVAREVIAKQMTAADGNKLIDAAIADVDAKLH